MPTLFSTYFYFWASLITFAVFCICFFMRKDLRKRMLKVGLVAGIGGVLSEIVFFQDYWHPPLLFRFGPFGGIEDFLFGLAAAGIGASIYDIVFHKRFRRKGNPHYWIIPVVIISQVLSIIIFFHFLKINSIFASSIGFLAPAIVIILVRRDLVVETLASAVLGGVMLLFAEIIMLSFDPGFLKDYYYLYNKAPLVFGLGPITEFVWGASFASLIGPLLDFDYGLVPINFSHKHKRKRKK